MEFASEGERDSARRKQRSDSHKLLFSCSSNRRPVASSLRARSSNGSGSGNSWFSAHAIDGLASDVSPP
jgi:hypothetical protein